MACRFQDLAEEGVGFQFIYALELLVQAHVQEVATHNGAASLTGNTGRVKAFELLPTPLGAMSSKPEMASLHGDMNNDDTLNIAFAVPAPPDFTDGKEGDGVSEAAELVFQAPELRPPCQAQDSCLEDLECYWQTGEIQEVTDVTGTRASGTRSSTATTLTCTPKTAPSVNSIDSFKSSKVLFSDGLPEVAEVIAANRNSGVHKTASQKGLMSILSKKHAAVDKRSVSSSQIGNSGSISKSTMSSSSDCPVDFEKMMMGQANSIAATGRLAWLVNHPTFEMSFACLIMVNTLTICLEAQYDGIDVGYSLGYKGYTRTAEETLPSMRAFLDISEFAFGILFTVEVLIKLAALHCMFFRQAWNVFDGTIMSFWVFSRFYDTTEYANPTMLRLLRLLKVMRIVRLFNTLSAVDSLLVLVKSIKGSFAAFVWCTILILVMITFVSLTVNSMIFSYFRNEAATVEERKKVFRHYGTFTRTATSFFEVTLGNFAPVMYALSDNVTEGWAVFIMLYKLIGGFAVITVIRGVFLQETFKVAASDDDLMLLKQRRQMQKHRKKIFHLIETATDVSRAEASLSWKQFNNMVHDPFIRAWLAAYEFDVSDAKLVFDLMDDGDGLLTVDELMVGVTRLKGAARSIDLHVVIHQVNELSRLVGEMQKDVSKLRKRASNLVSSPGVG